MTVRRCECCGAVVLENRIFKSDIRQNILVSVRENPGVNSERLGKLVYGKHEADDKSINLISVTIAKMNKELAGHGLRIIGRGGRNGGYSLVEAT